MKTPPFIGAFFCAITLAVAVADTPGPLQKTVPAAWSCDSFDAAMRLIGQETGLKVTCPAEIEDFMRAIPARTSSPLSYDLLPAPITAKEFLDQICAQLGLSWNYDATTGTLALGLPPKSNDSRPLSELLDYLAHASMTGDEMNDLYRKEWGTAFYSLLSADANMKTGWKNFILLTRENSAAYMGDSSLTPVGFFRPILTQQIPNAAGGKYTLILLCKPAVTKPGRASTFYYWFKQDGTLVGAGWMNLGYYSVIGSGPGPDQISPELHMALKGEKGFLFARFVLDEQGLKLTHLIDAGGKEVDPGDFGKPLMPGAAKP